MMTDTLPNFAATCYRRSGVAECCLRLQDNAGADVNLLLTAAWLAAQGRRWQHAEVRELITLCTSWREHCILPLRAVRRYLKDPQKQKDPIDTTTLYSQAKALELGAEIHQLYLLHDALQSIALKTYATADDALAANLQIYFDCIASAPQIIDADCRALIAALRQ